QRAWPGGEALLPFTDHPLAEVRSRAVGPVVASGHPRALGQLRDMAREADPAVAAAARAALESVRRAPPPLLFRLLGGFEARRGAHDLVDTEGFEVAARAALAERDPAARRTLLERAVRLWGGEPLPEDRYADWSRDWRRRLVDGYSGVLEALVDSCREEGDAR